MIIIDTSIKQEETRSRVNYLIYGIYNARANNFYLNSIITVSEYNITISYSKWRLSSSSSQLLHWQHLSMFAKTINIGTLQVENSQNSKPHMLIMDGITVMLNAPHSKRNLETMYSTSTVSNSMIKMLSSQISLHATTNPKLSLWGIIVNPNSGMLSVKTTGSRLTAEMTNKTILEPLTNTQYLKHSEKVLEKL